MEKLILNYQKKTISELMESFGLEPANFYWEKVKSSYSSDIVSILKYKESRFFFKFDFYEDDYHYYIYCPGNEKPIEKHMTKSWELLKIKEWLSSLKREIECKSGDVSKRDTPHYREKFTRSESWIR
ncbi:MAG: hypothetical protein HZA30_03610 [Candidatus Omnitrophica bacterium]|nr:hypothetical protein [Candidatus Omnitrophota bacterium]